MSRTFMTVAAVALVCSTSGWARDAKEDATLLEGTWLPAGGEFAGDKLPDEVLQKRKLVIKDGKYTVKAAETTDAGTLTLDAAKKPKAMDLLGTEGPNKDLTIEAIYEVAGDTLKICYALEGKERPKDFKTREGTKLLLITYKREKP